MNIIYELRNKLEEIINSIDIGETDLTRTDAYKILECIGSCCNNKKLYRGDLAYKLGIEISDIDKYIYVGLIPPPEIEDNNIQFWYNKNIDINKIKKEID